MKCIKCKSENITKSNYCKKCCYHFEEFEQLAARRRTLVGKLEWIEDTYKKWTLKKFMDKKIVKILSFIILILINVFIFYNNNKDVKLLENEAYKIEYNTKTNEYYLLIKEDSTGVDLYIPKRLKNMDIKKVNNKDEVLNSFLYNRKEKLVLEANSKTDYYVFEISYNDSKTDQIKVYVYKVI